MSLPLPYGGITVTVERPSYDRFNDASYVEHHTVSGCVEYPASSGEAAPNVGITDARTLLAPPGSDIQATDRIVLHDPDSASPPPSGSPERRAATYQVVGRPKDWVHAMTGWHPGTTVEIQKVT